MAGSDHAGSITGVKGWSGSAATTYPDAIFTWGCSGGLVNNIYETTLTSYPFLTRTFNRGSGDANTSDVFSLTVTNVPYARYDVIIYLSGSGTSVSTFRESVSVNGTAYYGDTSAGCKYNTAVGASSSWGDPDNTGLDYGINVLRVCDLTGDLTMQYVGTISHETFTSTGHGNAGIAAFQIVEYQPELIPSAPTEIAHASCAVYTNGVLSTDGRVESNETAQVVYTCEKG